MQKIKEQIEQYARSLGFDLVGFSPAKIASKYLKAFDEWLNNNHEADMSYMCKIEERRDLSKILPGAKSVIVLATNYYRPQDPLKQDHGRVARYAYGRDYHKFIGKRLKKLENFIQDLSPNKPCEGRAYHSERTARARSPERGSGSASTSEGQAYQTKSYVDTGPVLERALAEQAGIGRIGKNSCLITEEFGSWVFLSEIITTLDLVGSGALKSQPVKITAPEQHSSRWSDPSQPQANVCGNCTRCVDACPTGAIIAPGVIDSRLCISYLTIENRDKIPAKLAKIIAKTKRIYGCDICQEVCPHNEARQKNCERTARTRRLKRESGFASSSEGRAYQINTAPIANDQLSVQKISAIKTDQEFLEAFAGSPLMRAKKRGLKRNAEILKG